jgi:hypothetical protein
VADYTDHATVIQQGDLKHQPLNEQSSTGEEEFLSANEEFSHSDDLGTTDTDLPTEDDSKTPPLEQSGDLDLITNSTTDDDASHMPRSSSISSSVTSTSTNNNLNSSSNNDNNPSNSNDSSGTELSSSVTTPSANSNGSSTGPTSMPTVRPSGIPARLTRASDPLLPISASAPMLDTKSRFSGLPSALLQSVSGASSTSNVSATSAPPLSLSQSLASISRTIPLHEVCQRTTDAYGRHVSAPLILCVMS